MFLDRGPKDGVDTNPNMRTSSHRRKGGGPVRSGRDRGNSRMSFAPDCLAWSWAHDQPRAQLQRARRERDRFHGTACRAAGKVRWALEVGAVGEGEDFSGDRLSLRGGDRRRQYFCGFLEGKSEGQPGR